MLLFKTKNGIILERQDQYFRLTETLDQLICRSDLFGFLSRWNENPLSQTKPALSELLPPVETQEVWASGVTYFRSREARMDESKDAGGGDFYDRVYHAERPELFFKSTPARVVGTGQKVRIRRDSKWNVPEPELTLCINPKGNIIGYTIGNDMSSRDIEGENPLYLPQAKNYDGAAAIGPCIYLTDAPLDKSLVIRLEILRFGKLLFVGETTISQIKREFSQLVQYLCSEMSFPTGVFLMTGTGIVPPNEISLSVGDEVRIQIEPIGTLVNHVSQ